MHPELQATMAITKLITAAKQLKNKQARWKRTTNSFFEGDSPGGKIPSAEPRPRHGEKKKTLAEVLTEVVL